MTIPPGDPYADLAWEADEVAPPPDDSWAPPEDGWTPPPDPLAAGSASIDPFAGAGPRRDFTGTDARAVLREVYGYDAFRGEQGAIVDHVIAGGDAVVLMPTGGGKSVCYQVPALVRPGTGLVVSPLIALMHDQVDALVANGVRAPGSS
jgi:ATP-dependent DNA helicase RecQ